MEFKKGDVVVCTCSCHLGEIGIIIKTYDCCYDVELREGVVSFNLKNIKNIGRL